MKKDPKINPFIPIGLSILIGVIIFFSPVLIDTITIYSTEKNLEKLYDTEVFEKESNTFSALIQTINNSVSYPEKLCIISTYIQENFSWFLNNSSYSNIDRKGKIQSDPDGRMVIRCGKYADNPYFISYFKAGACNEHAVLAEFLANASGLTVRRVGDPCGYHGWTEILVNETEWYFYDPTIGPDMDNISKWFGKRENRMDSPVIQNAARVFNEDQDLTTAYPPFGTLTVTGCPSWNIISVNWACGSNNAEYFMKKDLNNGMQMNLTPKIYTIKRLLAYFIVCEEIECIVQPGEETIISVNNPINHASIYLKGAEDQWNAKTAFLNELRSSLIKSNETSDPEIPLNRNT